MFPPSPSGVEEKASPRPHLQHAEGLVRSVGVEFLVLANVHDRRGGDAAVARRASDAEHTEESFDSPPCRGRVVLQKLRFCYFRELMAGTAPP